MIDWKRTVRVGATDLFVPRIGLGTASLGNFLAPMTDDEAVAVMRCALAAGIRYIDTAPLYGHGLAEQRVAHAIKGYPREDLVLSAVHQGRSSPAGGSPARREPVPRG